MKIHVSPILKSLDIEQQVEWMLSLGAYLTISARNSYALENEPGNIKGLMCHNEIQHRLFGRIRDLKAGKEWTIESFIESIAERAEVCDVKADVGWAFSKALPVSDPK